MSSKKINLFLVGAQKSGTTSLHNMLISHSEIAAGIKKELHFFTTDKSFFRGYEYYENMFLKKDVKYLLDSSPIYMYLPKCIERIYKYNKNSKILVILRSPEYRAVSAYNFYKNFNKLSLDDKNKLYSNFLMNSNVKELQEFKYILFAKRFPSLKEFIIKDINMIENNIVSNIGIVRRGLYYEQIRRIQQYFDKKSIMIINYHDLFKKTEQTMENIGKFLDIYFKDIVSLHCAKTNYDLQEFKEEISLLKDFYKEDIENLYKIIDFKFNIM